jgi:hypothetical protein
MEVKMKKKIFLNQVEDFLKSKNISPTTLGLKSINDPRLVFMLRAGRECREETQERVLNFMKNYEKEYEKEAGSATETC